MLFKLESREAAWLFVGVCDDFKIQTGFPSLSAPPGEHEACRTVEASPPDEAAALLLRVAADSANSGARALKRFQAFKEARGIR